MISHNVLYKYYMYIMIYMIHHVKHKIGCKPHVNREIFPRMLIDIGTPIFARARHIITRYDS